MRRPIVVLSALGLTLALSLVLIVPAMAGWRDSGSNVLYQTGDTITVSQAREQAEAFLADEGYTTLNTGDVIALSNHFYVQVVDAATGAGALELVVSRDGEVVHFAPGPGMLWNTDYSTMTGSTCPALHDAMMQNRAQGLMAGAGMHKHMMSGADMPRSMMGGAGMQHGMMGSMPGGATNQHMHGQHVVTRGMQGMDSECPFATTGAYSAASLADPLDAAAAQATAQDWLDDADTGLTAGDVYAYPGYFTMLTYEEDGDVVGQVAVQATTGLVWSHASHGACMLMDTAQ